MKDLNGNIQHMILSAVQTDNVQEVAAKEQLPNTLAGPYTTVSWNTRDE